MECQPLAPLGKGRAFSSVWTSPPSSVARTVSWWRPGSMPVVSQRHTHWRHVMSLTGAASSASCQSPSSTRTSTFVMPRVWAQATPATGTVSPTLNRPNPPGVSMRLCVLIGARRSQPRSTQYWSKASKVVSSMSVIHFVADT